MPAFGSRPIRRFNSRPDLPAAPAPTMARAAIHTVPEATAYLQFRKASATQGEDLDALRVLIAHHQSQMNAAMPHQPPLVLMDVGWTTLSGRAGLVVDVRAQDVLGRWHDDGWCCPAWETPVPLADAQGAYRALFDRRSHRLGGAWQEWLGPLMSGGAVAIDHRLLVAVEPTPVPKMAVSEVVVPRARGLRR